jgi:hypothetical protein
MEWDFRHHLLMQIEMLRGDISHEELSPLYPHAPEHAWQALTNGLCPTTLCQSSDTGSNSAPNRRTGAPGSDGIVRCGLSSRAPGLYVGAGGVDTKVIWTLRRVPEGTAVTLDHAGF